MRILLLFLTFTFAGELEVEGDLKISGNIDAQNNPIKNVGVPQELTDAINGNVLQDALRQNDNYEYTFLLVQVSMGSDPNPHIGASGFLRSEQISGGSILNEISALGDELTSLFNDGWKLDSINSGGGDAVTWWIFKRPLEDE